MAVGSGALPFSSALASEPPGGTAEPLQFSCVAQPSTVFAGEPVTVLAQTTAAATDGKAPAYTWASTGGRISGDEHGARVDTAGVAAGSYIITGTARVGRRKAPGIECKTAFRVIENRPPTIACSANPARIVPGGFTSITAVAKGTENRQLSYSFGTTAGQITGTGPNATLAAADVNPGVITVKCNVVDDRGQAASANVTVEVATPPPPPVAPPPAARKLCSVSFARDRKRPVRVDNEGKGCLDDIALQLTRDANAKLVVVGNHDAVEAPEAAAQRTLNVKQYMTAEKGVDGSRIQVRTGANTGRIVDNLLVPQGATWDPVGTTGFDPGQVERRGEPYSRTRGK